MPSPNVRILCVEDDPDTRELTILTLAEKGFDVTCTDNADKALELAQTQDFDLYLLDNWLPGVSGMMLTKRLRQFDVKTPILFYSGAGFEADKEAARRSGAQGYLVKPVEVEDLAAEVLRLIGESRQSLKLVKPGDTRRKDSFE